MIHQNRKLVINCLAFLVFGGLMINMAFTITPTALAGNNPDSNLHDVAGELRATQTPQAPGNPSSIVGTSRLYLPIVLKAGGGPVITPTVVPTIQPGGEGALFLNRTKKTDSASAAVDAAGGFHLAYAAFNAMIEGTPAYYSYCMATCETASSWATAILIDRVDEVQLLLTSTGHPRLLLRGVTPEWNYFYKYAVCDSNCTNAASWTITDVLTTPFIATYENSYSGHHYFALDNLDLPRFLYQDSYMKGYYVYCDITCTNAANWWKYEINVDIFNDQNTRPALTFTNSGQPRITAIMEGTDLKNYLTYITCDASCINQVNWTYSPLIERGSGHISFVLKFTSGGQPRMVFNQGSINFGPAGYLYYLWCNTGCNNNANWDGWSVGEQGQVEDPDLALDTLNRPRIAFRNVLSPDGLGYFWCNTNCESYSAVWNGGLVEPSSDLDIEWDILPPLNCSGSYWWDGYRPSLVLDAAGNPRIGYVAQHLHGGGDYCWIEEDFRSVRFAFFNQP